MKDRILHIRNSFSIIDYIVLITAVMVLGFFFLYFTSKTRTVFIAMTSQALYADRDQVFPIGYHEADVIQVGDSVYNSFGQQIASVSEVKTVNYGGSERFIWVVVELQAKYNPRTKTYSFRETPLLIGNTLSLALGNVSFRGRILNVYERQEERYKNFTVNDVIATIVFRGEEQAQAEAITTFEAKNSNGEVIAKAINYSVRPHELDVPNDQGVMIHGESTLYKDVELTLFLPQVPCSENTCFFNDSIDLKVGIDYFWAHSDTTFLERGLITDLQILGPEDPRPEL